MKCTRCGIRESTGFLIALCDECFEAFDAEAKAGQIPAGIHEAVSAPLEADGLELLPVVGPKGRETLLVTKEYAAQFKPSNKEG